uniref:RING-type domain-containing protein n=1 Tax=Magallana gigas TaxID=29159 RepID=A0A8W8IML4_MAGGI
MERRFLLDKISRFVSRNVSSTQMVSLHHWTEIGYNAAFWTIVLLSATDFVRLVLCSLCVALSAALILVILLTIFNKSELNISEYIFFAFWGIFSYFTNCSIRMPTSEDVTCIQPNWKELPNEYSAGALSKVLFLSIETVFYLYTILRHLWILRSDRHNFWKNTTAIPKSKRGEQCPVCLADIWTGRVTSCGHVFHSGCLARCLNQSSVCPMCRSNIGAITKSR